MSPNSPIEVLKANHLLRSSDEVAAFEQALAELAQNPNPDDLPNLHLILDDACQQPEVMFSLVHFLESFDLSEQLKAFIQVMPDLVEHAATWTTILHSRITNDALAQATFEGLVRALELQEQEQTRQLLSSASVKISSSPVTQVA
ncbi:MAG: hypothetical protein JO235_02975 [Chroococcidiopsidaceae cyanobacterium CP_BM_RX_35]|nr:hypothetical protein [Chroococcidiopsidaceae cyanobacterium CP_BM_RX_35]